MFRLNRQAIGLKIFKGIPETQKDCVHDGPITLPSAELSLTWKLPEWSWNICSGCMDSHFRYGAIASPPEKLWHCLQMVTGRNTVVTWAVFGMSNPPLHILGLPVLLTRTQSPLAEKAGAFHPAQGAIPTPSQSSTILRMWFYTVGRNWVNHSVKLTAKHIE